MGRHCGPELDDGNWSFVEQQSPKAQDLAVNQGEWRINYPSICLERHSGVECVQHAPRMS